MNRRLLSLVLGAAALLTGCAGPPRSGPDAGDDASSRARLPAAVIDPSRSAMENLARLASYENASDAETAFRPVATPPGVDPAALSPRASDDRRARLSLRDAVAEIASAHDLSEILKDAQRPPAPPDLDAEDESPASTAALRHYVKGREAALADRHLVAANELQRALELDPSSLAIRRELARSLHAVGNLQRAAELYASVLTVEPDHAESLFSLGVIAANRREHEHAVALLGSRSLAGRGFDHDAAADLIASADLADALHALGYDRAAIEAAVQAADFDPELLHETRYGGRVMAVFRRQADTWRSIGDAHCRLSEYRQALRAYARSAAFPAYDPASLHPRVIYANLRLGRLYTAQLELLSALEGSEGRVSDRDIRLCAYLADHVAERDLLAAEVMAMHRRSPEQPDLARAAAALLPPDRAVALLREYMMRHPRELHVVSHLLTWLGQRDVALAVDFAAGLIADQPDLAGEYANRLVFAVRRPGEILAVLRRRAPQTSSPAHAVLEARVLASMGGAGEAWGVMNDASRRWPADRSLLWLRIELAAALEEPTLLAQAVEAAERFDDPITWLMRARAHRMLGQADRAVEAAEAATPESIPRSVAGGPPRSARDGDPGPHRGASGGSGDVALRAMLELAFTYASYATTRETEAERREWAREAAAVAEHVLEIDPKREPAYELLLTLHGPGGMLADQRAFRDLARGLYDSNPDSRVYARLAAEEAIAQGRHAQALDRLLNLYDSDPADSRALTLAVSAWVRSDRIDAALQWIGERLRLRPGDPALREQWVGLMLMQNRGGEVIHALTRAIEDDPDDLVARRLLESTYRSTGRIDEAFPLGEQRLLSRPVGVRRELELAALYAGAELRDRTLRHLRWVADHSSDATYQHLITAIAVIGRLEPDDPAEAGTRPFDEITVPLVREVVSRQSGGGVPLQIYGFGMLALARLGDEGEAFDELAILAAREARGASGASFESIIMWRDLAQALVNAGHAPAAARAMRARLTDESPLEQDAVNFLASVTLAADGACADDAAQAEATIRLVDDLAARRRLPQLSASGPATRAGTLFHASQVYSLLGRKRGAERLLREVIASDPANAMAKNNLSYAMIERGEDDPQAAAWAERALELEPDETSILDTVGWLRYRQGRFEGDSGALALIRRAVDESEEPSAEVFDHLGDALWRVGDGDGAAEAWRRAVELLADPAHRTRITRNLELLQTRGWGLLVQDPALMYDREFGESLTQIQRKLEAVERGESPEVAATFAELRGRE